MLSLAEVEKGHNCGFLVLWRISLYDLLNKFLILFVEFESNGRIVIGCVAMLGR